MSELSRSESFLVCFFSGDPLIIESCDEGVTIENECNKCVCTQNHVYECSPKSNNCKDDAQNNSCHPSIIYILNDTMCICNSSGLWPHEKCSKIFKSFGPHEPQVCKPNTYVTVDCNVCRCGADGTLDKARCTKNKCKNSKEHHFSKSRRISNNVYGNCEVQNWYSLAPCQFCFCVNENKLVCNTGNSYSHKLELGAYNLSVCGKELIREAIELIPEQQKALRYGIRNITSEEATPETATVKEIELHENNVAINVNREEGNLKLSMNNNQDDNDEYYTDSEETKPSIKTKENKAPSNPQSYNDESSKHLDLRKESEQELETDNETGVEIEAEVPKQVEKVKDQQPETVQTLTENFNLGEALKLNLPMVLDKVFQMALRKSMVSVDSESKCSPGAATILKCNVCFCMKENKLLCTNNVCE